MSDTEGDSDAPEECTLEQGFLQDQKICKIQKESKTRATLEGKQQRRRWARRRAPHLQSELEVQEAAAAVAADYEGEEGVNGVGGMLPSNIVELLAANEKKVFSSDSEEEIKVVKEKTRLKRQKPEALGTEAVIVKDIPPPPCLEKSLEFLKKRKMQVHRSFSVLDNSKQALQMLSGSGLLRN